MGDLTFVHLLREREKVFILVCGKKVFDYFNG